jgi:hypothetical protein
MINFRLFCSDDCRSWPREEQFWSDDCRSWPREEKINNHGCWVKHAHIPDNDYWGICLFHVVWTNFLLQLFLCGTHGIYIFFSINWTLRMSDDLTERFQILGHAYIICITVRENRIICCQIFCDLLLKSAFERKFNVMQLILVKTRYDYNLTIMKSPKPATDTIYPHIKFWWYRTMLNFYPPFLCGVLAAILKMADILKILKTQNFSSNGDLSLCQILCLYHYPVRSYQH